MYDDLSSFASFQGNSKTSFNEGNELILSHWWGPMGQGGWGERVVYSDLLNDVMEVVIRVL